MDANMKDIITNLKFLSNLQKHDKINTKYMFKEPVGLLTSLSRTFFYNDNRKNTLKFIETTINNGFDLLSYYERLEKLSDKAMCLNIVQDITQSKIGLENLKETYSNDLQFVCNIDTIIQTIEAKMKDVESRYSEAVTKVPYFLDDNLSTPVLTTTSTPSSTVVTRTTNKTNASQLADAKVEASPAYYSTSEPRSPLTELALPEPESSLNSQTQDQTMSKARSSSTDSAEDETSLLLPLLNSTQSNLTRFVQDKIRKQ